MNDLLAAATSMGPVTLRVGDLDATTAYYRDGVALEMIDQAGPVVTLGRGGNPVVVLVHSPDLARANPGEAGLFHTAILFQSEAALAAAVYSVVNRYPGTFTGSADHLVSKAFYFTDPEGNGVELYWDRDRSQWSWAHGSIEFATMFLDPNQFLREHLTEAAATDPMIGGAGVGHVHLQVGDVRSARDFYVDRLGFAATAETPGSALFVSAGGYHHHLAMNTWNSRGVGRRVPSLGLGRVDIRVPTTDDVGSLVERMKHSGVETRDDGRTVSFDDPWSNLIRVTAAP